MYVCVYAFEFVCMNADALRGHRYWVLLGLELKAVEPPDTGYSN